MDETGIIIKTKNPNEYRIDGKLYIKTIKHCKCILKEGDTYTVECRIKQRGNKQYSYQRDGGRIRKDIYGKEFWLSPDAEETISKAVEAFDAFVDGAENDFSGIRCEEAGLSIFYRRVHRNYDFVIRYKNAEREILTTEIYYDAKIDDILRHLQYSCNIREPECSELLRNPTKETIYRHPLIIAAQKYNDTKLEIAVKLHYHLDTAGDCSWLAKKLGLRVLPPLPEEFDKEYVIDADTMTDRSFALLQRSGYCIVHRPYFAMYGSTHGKYTLNPHTKHGVDAAKADAESIAFCDFLELFENGSGS